MEVELEEEQVGETVLTQQLEEVQVKQTTTQTEMTDQLRELQTQNEQYHVSGSVV